MGKPVSLVYLFGSHARGTADAESDIDVAILADPHLLKSERVQLRLDLLASLEHALSVPMEAIDVVVLQDVPVLLRYNVIRSGKVLLQRAAATRAAFEYEVEGLYDDERPMLDLEADLTLARLASRTR
jgi:predicted nucleotidyltransferase